LYTNAQDCKGIKLHLYYTSFMFPRSGQVLQASLAITYWRSNVSTV